MGKQVSAVCKLCRREGMKLFLKGSRCYTKSCSFERRDSPPGQHKWKKGKTSEYGVRLREKQKLKRYYGVYQTQFMNTYKTAERQKGNTGENLLVLLERRLDNVLFRGGLASSRSQARQFIGHGHVLLNGKKLDIASALVNVSDTITIKEKESSKKLIGEVFERARDNAPSWIEVSKEPMSLKVVELPNRSEVPVEIKEQLIVEFCSR